ncbi:MAG TPA: ABC transporter permease [Burkholderiales bacterium]|nr:ABC transporter permease [Burkholderiales bacterium]
MRHLFRLPTLSTRLLYVWVRNQLVWRKLALPSVLGNLADPMLYMLGLGYGLGAMLPTVNGTSYVAFLAAGTVCSSTMMTASFEAMYSGFSRMHVQKTWDAILNAPVTLDDVLLGEAIWTASKAFLSGASVLLVAAALGLVKSVLALWLLPLIFVAGLCFGGMGLIMTTLSPSYDFFMYYFTLVVTPMMLSCGVFFPMSQLPAWLQTVASALPLTHAVSLARPLMNGTLPEHILLPVSILILYALGSCYIALVLARRRLLT